MSTTDVAAVERLSRAAITCVKIVANETGCIGDSRIMGPGTAYGRLRRLTESLDVGKELMPVFGERISAVLQAVGADDIAVDVPNPHRVKSMQDARRHVVSLLECYPEYDPDPLPEPYPDDPEHRQACLRAWRNAVSRQSAHHAAFSIGRYFLESCVVNDGSPVLAFVGGASPLDHLKPPSDDERDESTREASARAERLYYDLAENFPKMQDAPGLVALIERERAALMKSHRAATASVSIDPTAEHGAHAVQNLLGDEGQQILEIARSGGSADDRMRRICAVDRRHAAWTSEEWSGLLGVSSAAVRQTSFWGQDRRRLAAAED